MKDGDFLIIRYRKEEALGYHGGDTLGGGIRVKRYGWRGAHWSPWYAIKRTDVVRVASGDDLRRYPGGPGSLDREE